jgi:hypothetical protein
MSAREVDDVAATAAGVTVLRAGVGAVTRWRAGGAGAGNAAVVVSLAAAVAAWGGGVFGTPLRAIGRALGNGTLDLADPSVARAGMPAASARLIAKTVDRTVDKAVDRDEVARAKVVTAVLRRIIRPTRVALFD